MSAYGTEWDLEEAIRCLIWQARSAVSRNLGRPVAGRPPDPKVTGRSLLVSTGAVSGIKR